MQPAFHLHCRPEDVGRIALLPGDPGRVETIAARLEQPRLAAANREFVTYTGRYKGELITVTSTGIGGPSAAIALEELAALGVKTAVRIGTCGGIAEQVKGGDVVIASAACRQEGTTREYAPLHYPATADYAVLRALADSAQAQQLPYHVGVVQSKDSFYGQHDPQRMPVSEQLIAYWTAWKRLNVLASEMETAALYVVGAALGVRVGTVLQTVWNQDSGGTGRFVNGQQAIDVAIGALDALL